MKRVSILTAVFVITAAACGGSTSEGTGTSDEPRPAATSPDSPAADPAETTTTAQEAPPADGPAQGRAMVTIGDASFAFTMTGLGSLCIALMGTTSMGAGTLADADGNEIQHEGARAATFGYTLYADGAAGADPPPTIEVNDNVTGSHWVAGPETPGSEIRSVSVRGSSTSGEALFVDVAGNGTPTPGTFQVTCEG